MPHSKPAATSRASSLKRLSEVMLPFQMMVPSRRNRTLRAPGDDPVEHVAPGDAPDPGDLEDLAHLGVAGDDLFDIGLQQAEHGVLDVLEHLVDDLVGPDLDALGLGQVAGLAVGPDVEADDRGAGGRGQLDVVLGDAADGPVHEDDLHLVALQLAQRLGERLERAGHVGLEDDVEGGRLALLDLLEDVLEPDAALDGRGVLGPVADAGVLAAGLADPAGGLVVGGDHEVVAGVGHLGQAEDLDRRARPGLLDLVALVVDERPDPAPRRTGDHRVAHLEVAPLHEHAWPPGPGRRRGWPRAPRRRPDRRGWPAGPRARRRAGRSRAGRRCRGSGGRRSPP